MGSRVQLHNILLGITSNVYYQAPDNISMQYPCIRYDLTDIDTKHADNKNYAITKGYTVTLITSDADSILPDQIIDLPMCRFERQYKTNNLYHDVFNIYY